MYIVKKTRSECQNLGILFEEYLELNNSLLFCKILLQNCPKLYGFFIGYTWIEDSQNQNLNVTVVLEIIAGIKHCFDLY